MLKFLFQKSRNNLNYPLMRDPLRNPRCYELTETERKQALKLADSLLKKSMVKEHNINTRDINE